MLNRLSYVWAVVIEYLTIVEMSLHKLNEAIDANEMQDRQPEELIPKEHPELLPLFNHVLASRFESHQSDIDDEVWLNVRLTQMWKLLYSISQAESVKLPKLLAVNITKEFVQKSSWSLPAPVLFRRKSNGQLTIYIDDRNIYS